MKNYFLITSAAFIFSGCVKDKPNDPIVPEVQLTGSKKAYVINEGPFQPGASGSVSLYDPGNQQVVEDFFKTQNNSELGNVVQSMRSINGSYYIVVNNAGKIVVCDEQLKQFSQITGLRSPRYILPVTNQKAYVSDLYANEIAVIDLNTNSKISTISCNGWTEQMVLIYNKVFVANMKQNYVYVINTLNDLKTDSVFVGTSAASLVMDRHDKVWVLSGGDNTKSIPAKLTKINTVNNTVEFSVDFDASDMPSNLCLNKTKDTLYFLNNGIFRLPVSATVLPTSALVPSNGKSFYGLGINPNDYSIYVSDAIDYQQRSNIYIFDTGGNQKSVFKAGIISTGFYFE